MATTVLTPASKTKKARAKPPADETPAQRFVRVAGSRVLKALDQIDLLANCVGASYAYTSDQVIKLETALNAAVKESIATLKTGKKASVTSKGFF